MFPRAALYAKYLIMETEEPTLRSDVQGWDYQDIAVINPEKPIGLSPNWNSGVSPHFTCVAFALAAGWVLMGPPVATPTETDDGIKTYWTWWLLLDQASIPRNF